MNAIEVVVRSQSGELRTERFEGQQELAVGRDADCTLCLHDHHVSRRHALLRILDGMVRIEDVSSNGTLAGDLVLKRSVVQVPFDTPIGIGTHTLFVRRVGPAAGAATPGGSGTTATATAAAAAGAIASTTATATAPATATASATASATAAGVTIAPAAGEGFAASGASADLRREIHRRLVEYLDLAGTEAARLDDPSFRPRVLTALRRIMGALGSAELVNVDVDLLVGEMADEALGLGPLERLLADPTISEVMVLDADTIYVERAGKLVRSAARFTDEDRVRAVIERIVTPLGRRIDESSPLVDARLPDGSRVNAIIKPLALRGSCITIRRFSKTPLTLDRLFELGSLSPAMGRFLTRSVVAERNIVISGGTGSGKTSLLNVLSSAIPEEDRIVTIEDSAELQLNQPHVVSLETRPSNMEGKGQVSIRDLVKNALRMRPDRIVVGECRGGEALDMLQAMNTGHDGSLTTTHANSPEEALSRLETLALMAGIELPSRAIREQIAASVHLVVQQSRLSDGSRKVTAITEICGLDRAGEFEVRPIYRYLQTGVGPTGNVLGHFAATGYLPTFLDQFVVRGLVARGEPYL